MSTQEQAQAQGSSPKKSLLHQMFDVGVHFGHQTKFWNPKMKEFIFCTKNNIHIINLDKTVKYFNDTLKFIEQTIKNNQTIWFVGTRTQSSAIIEAEAKRANMPYVNHRWLGGMLTNFETVKKSIDTLKDKKALLEKLDNDLSKKEILTLTREVAKLESSIGGIVDVKKIPYALFIIDTGCHDIAIKEAKKLGIKIVGVVDTNNNPDDVDYIIPGNDDAVKAIQLYCELVSDKILQAKQHTTNELLSQIKIEMIDHSNDTKTTHRIKKSLNEEGVEIAVDTDTTI